MAISKFMKKAKEIEETRKKSLDEPHQAPGEEDSSWLVSYADLMTLLCAFFIMMFSMATLKAPQYEKVRKEVAKQFGGDLESDSEKLAKFVTQIIQEAGIETEAVVVQDPVGISIIFQSTLFFDSLSAYVSQRARIAMGKLILALVKRQEAVGKTYRVMVEGHTDSKPIVSGNYPSNWELSSARAARVVRLFVENGFDSAQMLSLGYGGTRPRVPDREPSGQWIAEALKENRRVVVRIMDQTSGTLPWEHPELKKDPSLLELLEPAKSTD